MSDWLYLAAGKEAVSLASAHAKLRGDQRLENVLVAGSYSGVTMRDQEQEALAVQLDVTRNVAEKKCRDVTVFVEVGSSAGALLVLVEAAVAAMLVQATRKVGAVVVIPRRVDEKTDQKVLQDLDLLGQALWTYTLDGRLAWSLVTDTSPTNMLQMTPALIARKQFGSRLYGE